MREIKFRAWDKESNTIRNWVELKDGFKMSLRCLFESLVYIPMQYTGFKNETEIYEGDIVEIKIFKDMNGKNYEVAFIDGCFELCDATGNYVYDLKQVYSISWVIGNIYENPELLKKEK